MEARKGIGFVGLVFLALGLFKLLTGEPWVVWIILGVLLGGLGLSGGIGLSGGKKGDAQP